MRLPSILVLRVSRALELHIGLRAELQVEPRAEPRVELKPVFGLVFEGVVNDFI